MYLYRSTLSYEADRSKVNDTQSSNTLPGLPGAELGGGQIALAVNLRLLGAIAGPIRVSFDVYDKAGNANLAPNGEHTITYAPRIPQNFRFR